MWGVGSICAYNKLYDRVPRFSYGKNKDDSKMSNSARNGKKNWREMLVFVDSGCYAAVSSQFHLVHTFDSHHTKGEPLNSLLKAFTPSYRQVLLMLQESR